MNRAEAPTRLVLRRAAQLALAFTLLVDAAAGAPARKPSGAGRALDLFEQSAVAYREGRFQDAVDKLLEARRLKPEPVLLYNLARAYEALGRWEEAADAYAQYLAEEPAAADRKAIEGRIATMRAQAAELAAARKPEPRAEPEPAPQPVVSKPLEPARSDALPGWVPWTVVGVGAAATSAGLVLGALANQRHDDAVAEPEQQSAVDLQQRAESLARAATITIFVGVVVALAGGAWVVLRTSRSSVGTRTQRAPRLGPLAWTF